MAIHAYTGLPGHGKSYGVVENVILPALREGRHVVHNMPLYEEKIRATIKTGKLTELPTDEVVAQPEKIWEYAVNGCVLVLDELWKIFPAGISVNKAPQPFKTLLAEHRHRVDESGNSMSIVFCTQDLGQISRYAFDLVEQTFIVTKLVALGAPKRYRVDVYSRAIKWDRVSAAKAINSTFGSYQPEIYNLYKSHTMSDATADGANEKSQDSRGVLWRRPSIMFGLPLAAVAAIGGVSYAYSFFTPEVSEGEASRAVLQDRGRVVRTGGGSLPVSRARVAGTWIIADSPDESMVFIDDGTRTVVMPMRAAHCMQGFLGGVECVYEGQRIREAYSPRPIESKPSIAGAFGMKADAT